MGDLQTPCNNEGSIDFTSIAWFFCVLLLSLSCAELLSLPHCLDNQWVQNSSDQNKSQQKEKKTKILQATIILLCTWYTCLLLWFEKCSYDFLFSQNVFSAFSYYFFFFFVSVSNFFLYFFLCLFVYWTLARIKTSN